MHRRIAFYKMHDKLLLASVLKRYSHINFVALLMKHGCPYLSISPENIAIDGRF